MTLRPWIVLAIAAVITAPAPAQRTGYKADEVDRSLRSRGTIVKRFLQSGEGDAQEFRDYFKKYYFPAMTQPTPDGLESLGKYSNDLFKTYLDRASGANQKFLSDEALRFAADVVRERRYHPAVRLNALLILGRLNDDYSKDNAVPSVDANNALCGLVTRAVTNGRVPRYELTGALTGLARHAEYLAKLPKRQRSNTMKTLYTVLKTDDLAGEYDEGVRDWVYLQAADAVSKIGTPGPRGVFALTLAKRFSDKSLSLETRAELASLLDGMKGKPGAFDSGPLVKATLGLASEIGERESEFARAYEDLGSSVRAGRSAVMDRALKVRRVIDDGNSNEATLAREAIVELLADLLTGVRATSKLAGEQASLSAVEGTVDEALTVASDKSSVELDVTESLRRMAKQIEAAAAPVFAPAAEEEAAAE